MAHAGWPRGPRSVPVLGQCALAFAAAATLAFLIVAFGTSAAQQAPILATEDSLRTYTAPDTTRVVARRVPLAEIIRKAQEGERRKYEGIKTLAFDRIIKITLAYGDSLERKRCIESVNRVYYRAPDGWTEVGLREQKYEIAPDGTRKPWDEEDKDGIQIEANEGEDAARRLSELPPYLEDTEMYRFEILNRSIRPGQVLYEIGFEPKSDFGVRPGGRVWLLTNGYQIVREEYHMKNIPMPWVIDDVGLLTRDWQEIQGRWLPKRITARVGLKTYIGFGLVKVPRTVEAVLVYDNFAIDAPLDPALFEGKKR